MKRRGFFSSLLTFGAFQTTCMATAGVASPTDLTPTKTLYVVKANDKVIEVEDEYCNLPTNRCAADRSSAETVRLNCCIAYLTACCGWDKHSMPSDFLELWDFDRHASTRLTQNLNKRLHTIGQSLQMREWVGYSSYDYLALIDIGSNSIARPTIETIKILEAILPPLFIVEEIAPVDGVYPVDVDVDDFD